MDTKELYKTYRSKQDSIVKLDKNEEMCGTHKIEHYYCGLKDDFKADLFYQAIDEFFLGDELYFLVSPNKFFITSKSKIIEEIRPYLGKDIKIMDKDFTKIIIISNYGVYNKGIFRDFPKTRSRPEGKPLRVRFYHNILRRDMGRVSDILDKPLDILGEKLSNDYNGEMEHLWISIELAELNRKPWPFRFQKRVNFPESDIDNYSYNVGHYSILPDLDKLKELPDELVCNYILSLLYHSTEILSKKKRQLGKFNVERFRSDFVKECEKLGYSIEK